MVSAKEKRKLVIAISGASGAIFALRTLEALRDVENAESHLICSVWGERTISEETGKTMDEVRALVDFTHEYYNLGAAVASGSFQADAMAVVPCSMKKISAIANGYTDDLISRAADVMLKEKRRLVLVPRETPFNLIHLKNMTQVAEAGAMIMPLMPAFYNKPKTIEDVIKHFCGRLLDLLGVPNDLQKRWEGKEYV